MEIFIWIKHHFMILSMVWLPAFLFYLRIFVDSCKVAGYTKLADKLGRFELFLTTFVAEAKGQNQSQNTGNPGK